MRAWLWASAVRHNNDATKKGGGMEGGLATPKKVFPVRTGPATKGDGIPPPEGLN